MTAGHVLLPAVPNRPGYPKVPTIDARNAAAEALAEYLMCAEFLRYGKDAADTPFKLTGVDHEWPEPDQEMHYPRASIIDSGKTAMEAHALVPTPLEETLGRFEPNTVLWKTAEASCLFQVDFWTDDAPTREAIAALLPRLFAPGEDRYAVMLCTSARYFCQPARMTLIDYRRDDTAGSVYPRERRLLALVRCEIDVIDLRCATLLAPSIKLEEIGENVEPGTEPAAVAVECK